MVNRFKGKPLYVGERRDDPCSSYEDAYCALWPAVFSGDATTARLASIQVVRSWRGMHPERAA